MARKKVKLAFIANDASRKATFKKRNKGLLKKVSELSTLCGVEACAVIYSPYDTQPEVWPNAPGAEWVISKFKQMPEMEQSKKMMNQESFIKQRTVKANEQLKRQRENNREKQIREMMYQCLMGTGVQNLGVGELNHLEIMLDQNMKEINKRMELLANGGGLNVGGVGNNEVILGEQNPSVDFRVQAMQRPQQRFNEWNDQNELMDFGGGLEMMLTGGDNYNNNFNNNNNSNNNNNNATWSSLFFP